MPIVPILTIRNGVRLFIGLMLVSTCAVSNAQQKGVYPLYDSNDTPFIERPQTNQPPAKLTIRRLPSITTNEVSTQQQPLSPNSNSNQQSHYDLTNRFSSAYEEINGSELNFTELPRSEFTNAPNVRVASARGIVDSGNETTYDESFATNSAYPMHELFDSEADDFLTSTDASNDSDIWWKQRVLDQILAPSTLQNVDTNGLVYQTLHKSPRIRALSQNPLIRELQIIEADSEFDPTSFVRSQFQDRVDPVGDNLSITSDGSEFLQDNIWSSEFGIRKKNRTGMTYEVGETLGFKNSNSSFFVPQDQGTATLALNVTQPLLRGSGRYYNESQILIAQSAGGAAWDTFVSELQNEIQKTVKAYWQLYFDRSVYLQKQRNVERGELILRTLEGRRDLDSLPSQITRARSAVQSRKTDLANALRDIRNSETELRRLTANRDWKANQSVEMIPTESPTTDGIKIELEQVVFTALENRPDIKETIARAKIAGIQRDISENELLPELSLLLGTYVSALKGDSQLGQAIQDQFGEVTPGYSVGFEFELPIRNRAARTRLAQRQLQLAKIRAEVEETMQNVIAESQVSLRRVTSAKETLDAALQAIQAANADLQQNFRRWESFALIEGDIAEGQTPTTVLDQLLDSQERLTAAELVYTQSELELKTSEVALKRTMGTLLLHENVTVGTSTNGDLPEMLIDQGTPAAK